MLGLLGTILGIIVAFKVIAAHTGPVSPNMIADGLWEAMLTTAAGLFIALPCLLVAHIFRSLGEKQLGDFCLRLNKLSMSFEMEKSEKKPEMAGAKVEKLAA
jgi:biopolymer transport protein ExbB